MRNDFLSLLFAVVVLFVGAGAEEMLPKFLGVGVPALLAASLVMSVRRPVEAVLFAIAAGAVEDALSSLPAMTSVSFFLSAVGLVRRAPLPKVAAILVYPAYQVWLAAWTGGVGGSVFGRALVALPLGAATVFAAEWLILLAERRAAIGEQC